VEIRVGITNTPRELSIESDASVEDIEKAVAEAIDGGRSLIRLADSRGRVYLIPSAALSFIEIGAEETRRVGFVA